MEVGRIIEQHEIFLSLIGKLFGRIKIYGFPGNKIKEKRLLVEAVFFTNKHFFPVLGSSGF